MTETIENHTEVERLLHELARRLREHIQQHKLESPRMIGIHSGGAWVARHLHALMDIDAPLGSLDISFYRDDFSRIGLHPKVNASEIPFNIEGQNILLVDDVLHTGRTIRAAMNEIFDYGRPASITLAVLAERSGRELPIKADAVGIQLALKQGQHVKLSGPDNLELLISNPTIQGDN